MSGLTVECEYRYLLHSQLTNRQLILATSMPLMGGIASVAKNESKCPHFFCGQLMRPRRTAELLRALMNIVKSRFHIPAAMLKRILAESDPVVTCSQDRIRFEGFSACCGAYARIDLLPEAVNGRTFICGTTNVDFNQPMLTALAKIRESDRVEMSIGLEGIELTRNLEAVIEKKVALPLRWLKGFVEVQSCQSRMTLVHEVDGREATRFLRELPRMKTNRRETFVVSSGRGLRVSQLPARDSVRIGGLERLRVLEALANDSQRMQVFTDETTGASGWILHFSDCRFCLVISPEVWRGFSGEGQALKALAVESRDKLLPLVREQLTSNSVVDEEELHRRLANLGIEAIEDYLTADSIRSALCTLGTQGLVGYDLVEGCWFHRELPFNLDEVDKQHPRLKDAKTILADGRVQLGSRGEDLVEVMVKSGGVEHRVRLSGDQAKCTCPWYAKYGTARGPCKHILASQLLLECIEDDDQNE